MVLVHTSVTSGVVEGMLGRAKAKGLFSGQGVYSSFLSSTQMGWDSQETVMCVMKNEGPVKRWEKGFSGSGFQLNQRRTIQVECKEPSK